MTTNTGMAHSNSVLSGDNKGTSTAIKQQRHDSDSVHYHDASTDRIFNNPIYGGYDDTAENILYYEDIDTNYQVGTRMELSPTSDYKFDNPIYD